MTPAEAIAKLRELRESDPLDTTVFAHAEWSRASTVLEVEHARLVREAMEGAKRLKDAEATNTRLTRGVERAAAVIDQRAKDCAAEASDCEGATRRAELRSMSEGYRRAAILLRDAVATDATSDNPSFCQPEVKP